MMQKYDEFKKLGVDVIAVLSFNDAFVMSGWGRFSGLTDKVTFDRNKERTHTHLKSLQRYPDSLPLRHGRQMVRVNGIEE